MTGYPGYLLSGAVGLSVGVLLKYCGPRPKIVYWSPHSFLFNVKENNSNIALLTDSLSVQNIGHKEADNIEIIFQQRPDHFQFQPSIQYQEDHLQSGEYLLRVAKLAKNEYFTLQLLSYKTAPKIQHIRCDSVKPQLMPFQIQRVLPKWSQRMLAAILLIGCGTIIYWLWKLLESMGGRT